MLTYNVKNLSTKRAGTIETHVLDEAVVFQPEETILPRSHLTGKLIFMKLPHGINARLEDGKIDVEATCGRCLKRFSLRIEIPGAEREFIIDLPSDEIAPGEDVFYVDRKTWEISLLETIRQEILLHFPAIPLCSEACQGLCPQCGTNLNEKICGCTREVQTAGDNKPFKILKSV